jgi:hypothetical protein
MKPCDSNSLCPLFKNKVHHEVYPFLPWHNLLLCRSAAARLLELRVRIPPGAWMSISYECRVLSGRGLCVGLITRPEDSYRMWMWLILIVKPWQWGSLGPLGLPSPEKKKHNTRWYIANQNMSLEFFPCISADRYTVEKGVMVCRNVCKIEQQKNVCYWIGVLKLVMAFSFINYLQNLHTYRRVSSVSQT